MNSIIKTFFSTRSFPLFLALVFLVFYPIDCASVLQELKPSIPTNHAAEVDSDDCDDDDVLSEEEEDLDEVDSLTSRIDQKNILGKVGYTLLLTSVTQEEVVSNRWITPLPQRSFVEAYDYRTGQCQWIYEQPEGLPFYTFLIVDKKTVILRCESELVALNIKTGKPIWRIMTQGDHSFLNKEGWY